MTTTGHVIDKLLRGSVDLHMHLGPDEPHEPRLLRRVDVYEGAQQALAAGQRAIVLKSHQYPTAPLATLVSRLVPGILLVGGIALNAAAGGLNPAAVELSARLGGRVVWMPTIASRNHRTRALKLEGGLDLLDGDELRPEVHQILDVVERYDQVLCTGHVSPPEGLALMREARRRGLTRLVATHPTSQYSGYSPEQQAEMADLGALIEFTFLTCMPAFGGRDPGFIVERVRDLGVDRCVVTTDFGQIANPPPSEGMRIAIGTLLEKGLCEDEVGRLVRRNPARVLGLEDEPVAVGGN